MTLKRARKILKWFFISLLLLIAAVYIFIQTPFGQKWIGGQITKRLSRDLKTKVTIAHIDFSLFNRMHLEGVVLEDRNGDTLLFAGDMKMRITDWFFLKKQADIKYLGLENAIIKFQRTDSVWSQQFLFDYFSSPKGSKPKKKAGIVFSLKEIDFKNVRFIQKDAWMGQDMRIDFGEMKLNADSLSLSGNQYVIKELFLKDPVIVMTNYTRKKPPGPIKNLYDETVATGWNMGSSVFKIGNVKIVNGTFQSERTTAPVSAAAFDGAHLLFTEINGELSGSSFIGDTVLSRLKLTAKEKSGLLIKNLSANLKMTPQGMFFDDLDLETNRSHLKRYYAMTYRNISDMGSYIHKVQMQARFDDSYIDSDDLAFFAPAMKSWNKLISVRGNISGTVDEIKGTALHLQAGNSTVFNGDLLLKGLPNVNSTYIDIRADDLRSTYSDAVTIVPALRKVTKPDLRAISFFNYQGTFKGYISDFNAVGTVRTNLGTAKTNLTVKSPARGMPSYIARINTDGFQLGGLLHNKALGRVAMNGTVSGSGKQVAIDAKLPFAEYQGYRYHDITVDGKLVANLFSGYASVRDPNADVTVRGQVDLNTSTPRFNMVADVAYLDLFKTGWSKDSIIFHGLANLDFNGNNLDNFSGTARISNAELTRNGHRLPFDSLVVSSQLVNGKKHLSIESNEFTAKINGDFRLSDLPNAVTYMLNKYYPSYISAPKRLPGNEDVNFDIWLYSVDEYMQLIDSRLGGFNNSHFEGRFNLLQNELELNAEVPQFRYGTYNFNFTKFNAKGTADSLVLTGEANDIRINDSLSIPQALFHINAHNDSSRVSIRTGAKAIEKADLNALVLTYSDGLKVEFDSSNFTINGKVWTIDPNGELVLRRNTPASGNLVISEADQRIVIKTEPAPGHKWNDIHVELTKLNLGDISPYFLPKNRLEGLLSGTILVQDPTGNLKVRSDDISTQFLRIDNDSLGELKSTVYYDNLTGELKIKGNTLNKVNYLGFDANIYLNKDKAKDNLILLDANNFQLTVLQRFLGSIFSEMKGYLTGNIRVSGPFDEVSVTGKAHLKDAGVRIKMTQCFYWIRDTDIELGTTEIDFGGLFLTDSITGNPIYVNRGRIEHESFKNMFYDIDISTRRPGSAGDVQNLPVQLLNTTYADSKQFYGNVRGTASLSLTGPQSDMFLKIDAVASTVDSSYITLPPSSGKETGIADFLVERKYGREMTPADLRLSSTNIIYDIDLAVNKTPVPMVTVNVVLDDLTGDEIKGKGYGAINIHSGTNEPLSLRGRFNIVEGRYMFTFQSFFKKPFDLRTEHDNYIEWNGDPYNAYINFEAVYRAERVSFAPLGQMLTSNSKTAVSSQARGDVYVIASLKDSLFKPTIEFTLDFPSSSIAVSDPELALIFQQMQKNPDEITRQATYLIVFNSFAPSSESGGNYSVTALGLTTISGIFLNVINDQINKVLGKLLKSDDVYISLNTSIYNRNVIDLANNAKFSLGGNINFAIGKSFFNNRFRISTGVGYDAPFSGENTGQNFSQQLLPDVTMEWLINPSGTVRASFFYRENTDYLNTATVGAPGKARRVGANLSYRKDFDRFGDIFRRKKRVGKEPEKPSEQEGIPVKGQ